ncbi:hypothetical protein SLS62_007415 [Diatrype stigma]|uniref:Uncharacterized protein n=1 Tax=Diatrype stigma TaxID=117547 RepID=A0AAN9UR13_9PEZI
MTHEVDWAFKTYNGSGTYWDRTQSCSGNSNTIFGTSTSGRGQNCTVQIGELRVSQVVQLGPFRNLQISLGPVAKEVIDSANPRCLSRNFDPASSAGGVVVWDNATAIMALPTVAALRASVESRWHRNAFIDKEGAGPFSPTKDSAFYPLCPCTPRSTDLEGPTYAIDGNRTFLGLALDYAPAVPPSLATIEITKDGRLHE